MQERIRKHRTAALLTSEDKLMKRKPGVPSREEMYEILKRRSEELKTVPEVLLDQGVTLEEYQEEQRKESLRKRGLLFH